MSFERIQYYYEAGLWSKPMVKMAVRKGVITSIGYVLVMLIVGGLREVIGAGTLYGMVVFQKPILPIAALPSGGFIFLAVLVALWRGFVTAAKHQLGGEEG